MEAARVRDRTGGARAASLLAWSQAALAVALFAAQFVLFMLALVYGSLTVTLVSLYFGGVELTRTLFRILTGQQQPQLAVVVSTLPDLDRLEGDVVAVVPVTGDGVGAER